MELRDFALKVVQRLRAQGFAALWAGGCVRDQWLGIPPHDYDVATDAPPAQVQRLFRRTVAVGAQFGVVEVLGPRPPLVVQVATFRSDGTYSDGRHPDTVRFGTAQADAQRRDFTINGMFFDPIDEAIIDFVGGLADLQAGIVRAIGDPEQRFREDKLRLLRAVRFAARFQFQLDPATHAAIRQLAPDLHQVSPERITDELKKLLKLTHRALAMRHLAELGLLAEILPEAAGITAVPGFAILGGLQKPTFPAAMVALLWDLQAALPALALTPDWVRNLAGRMRWSNDERDRVLWLLAQGSVIPAAPTLRPSVLKPLLVHPGIDELLDVESARAAAQGRLATAVAFCQERLAQWTAYDLNPPPLLTGDDLKTYGLQPGPYFKPLLDRVRQAQLDGEVASREAALALAVRLAHGTDEAAQPNSAD
jgi:tRNA nucleotidyltransferase/poly(A) polymerase